MKHHDKGELDDDVEAREEMRHNVGANRDPISGAPGAHPLGTGVGAALGGVASGALAGAVAGPPGMLLGAAAGAVLGGLAGKAVGEAVDPTFEYDYWREHFTGRPYVLLGDSYADYGPAYGYGVDAYLRFHGRDFDTVEVELAQQWVAARGASSLEWEQARLAARDAWLRLEAAARLRGSS
jgi:hypothetical protein